MKKILVINPGASSTKIAVFEEKRLIFKNTIEHKSCEIQVFSSIFDQYQYRLDLILEALDNAEIQLDTIDAVVGRGGLLKPLAGGTYTVNELMLDDLRKAVRGEHASNLGAVIAHSFTQKLQIPAFIVDPVSVDEMEPIARISGLPELPRISLSHALNSKAIARKVAKDMGKSYEEVNFIIAHLGSGISVSAHLKGRMIDVNNSQEEGPFSPDRCGGLPSRMLIKLCFSGQYIEDQILTKIMGSGGMYAYLGTKDIREAEKRAAEGDELADNVLNAMTYQISKEIGAMATVLCGNVDRIILTGGLAYSNRIVGDVIKRTKFIALVVIVPGEEELESLAAGALRILNGEESPRKYQ